MTSPSSTVAGQPRPNTPHGHRRPSVGITLVLAGACLFILNSGVSRVALRSGIDSLELASLRITGTFLVLLAVVLVVDRRALRVPRGRELVLVVALGIVGVALLQWLYFVAIDRLTISLALLLEFQAPVLVALWAKFIQGAEVSSRLWWGLLLAVLGLACVTEVWSGATFDTLGVAAALGAAVAFAAYFLIGEAAQHTMSALGTMLWAFGVAAVGVNLVLPFWTVDAPFTENVSMLGTLSDVHLPLWLVVTSVVVLGTLLPFGFELAALRHVPPTTVTAIAMLEPVGAAALAWAWHEEALSAVAVIGCLMVVGGIVLAEFSRKDHTDEPVPLT